MFERFTAGARSAVLDAETHARGRSDAAEIRSEHLLLGVLRSDDSPVVRLIETHVTRESAATADSAPDRAAWIRAACPTGHARNIAVAATSLILRLVIGPAIGLWPAATLVEGVRIGALKATRTHRPHCPRCWSSP